MDVQFDHKIVLKEYYSFNQILGGDYKPATRNIYETYTGNGFARYQEPDFSEKFFYYIGYCPENENFAVHLYIPLKYILNDKISTEDLKTIYEKYGRDELRNVYEWRMSLVVNRYSCLGITDYRVEGDETGKPLLVCVIPGNIFGKERVITAECINDLDFLLEQQNDECPGKESEKFKNDDNNFSIGYIYKKISENMQSGNTNKVFSKPYYSLRFRYSPEYDPSFGYFDKLFWELINLAVLGSPKARKYARKKICEMMYLSDRYRERERREQLLTESGDNGDTPEDTAPDMMNKEEQKAAFKKYIDDRIKAVKDSGDPEFCARVLCNERALLDPYYFSKIRNGRKKPGRKILLKIGIGLDLTPDQIAELFRLQGLSYPLEPHEFVVNSAIEEGNYGYLALIGLIPEDENADRSNEQTID